MQATLFGDEEFLASDQAALALLQKRAQGCFRCGLSKATTVFGEGRVDSPKVAFVGEAPGAVEDAQGRPFVGPSGLLLNKMVQAMGLERKDVYLCNTVCCFPGDVRVETENPRKLFRRRYEGEMIRIKISSGHSLPCTPNHPILTRRGFVAAKSLRYGDDLVCCSFRKEVSSCYPNIKDVPSSFQELGDATSQICSSHRIVDRNVNFHGDGSSGQIEVVPFDRKLKRETSLAKFSMETPLTYPKLFRKSLDTLSRKITIGKVIEVNNTGYSGHVYNLETDEGWYTANGVTVSNCRPPDNRKPTAEEVTACKPFLLGQIRAIQPQVLVALGASAAQVLLKTKLGVSSLREEWHAWEKKPLRVTFHPAYLLRNKVAKKMVWDDLQAVMGRLGLLPAKVE
jgi:uracil-DNA glycosylase